MFAQQLGFDIEDMIRQARNDAAPAWEGMPLQFTTDYHSPAEHAAAYERYALEHGDFGIVPRSHLWHPPVAGPRDGLALRGHTLHLLMADTRPERAYQGPGALLYQAICEPCRWHLITLSENAVAEAWYDHADPSWRDLPVMPKKLTPLGDLTKTRRQAQRDWVESAYPAEWRVPGAPILTAREGRGTRHVPDRSPLGGYDFCAQEEAKGS